MIKFRPVKSKQLNVRAFESALREAVDAITRDVKLDFESTTDTWRHKPKFRAESTVRVSGGVVSELTWEVMTDDEIYGYVSEGTRPHVIVPVKARALRFQPTYLPKTRPGLLGSTAGGPSGEYVFAKSVQHPGTKARQFEKVIRQKWERALRGRYADAFRRAAQASGHAL